MCHALGILCIHILCASALGRVHSVPDNVLIVHWAEALPPFQAATWNRKVHVVLTCKTCALVYLHIMYINYYVLAGLALEYDLCE